MNIEINIPEKLSDITLKQWQEISSIDPDADADFQAMRVLNIVYGLNGRDIKKLKSKDIAKLVDAVTACLNEKPELVREFSLDGVEYGLIPNLDEMTGGELFDLDTNSTKEKYHLLMSILFRPIANRQIGDRYQLESYTGTKDMSHMRADVAIGVLAFFLTLGEDLINSILSSLTQEEQAAARKHLSIKNGVGFPLSMPSVMETFSSKTS